MIDEQTRWEKTGHFPKADIQRLIDNVDSLWNNGDPPGMNDRMPVAFVMNNIKTSLVLIKLERLVLKVSNEHNRIRGYSDFLGFKPRQSTWVTAWRSSHTRIAAFLKQHSIVSRSPAPRLETDRGLSEVLTFTLMIFLSIFFRDPDGIMNFGIDLLG
nr:hypothetical protein [Candidatus Sigynarchaeota archaeon]